MKTQVSRRSFLSVAGSVAAFTILPRRLLAGSGETPPSETVLFAAVGVGGQGRSDLKGLVDGGFGKVVAIADVDPRSIAATKQFLPDVQAFEDYREMYGKLGKSFDAVLVPRPTTGMRCPPSTPCSSASTSTPRSPLPARSGKSGS